MRYAGVWVPVLLVACATEVNDDVPTPGDSAGSGGTAGSAPAGGTGSTSGGSTGGSSKAGSSANAFGGAASTGGSAGASSTAGTAGAGTAGAGTAGAGTAGTAGATGGAGAGAGGAGAGGTAGGSAGAGGGTAGSPPVGTGDCAGTPAFVKGATDKYALDAKVIAVCAGGTPCINAMPPLAAGKTYEFKCVNQYNCGGEDPGSTNWSQPPWAASKACEE